MSAAPAITFPRWINPGAGLREVDTGLFVGGLAAPFHITCAGPCAAWIDLAPALSGSVLDRSRRRAVGPACRVDAFTVPDGEPIPDEAFVLAVCRDATRAAGSLLITCGAGSVRSAALAYAVLRVRGLDHAAALARVTSPGGPIVGGVAFRSAVAWVERCERGELDTRPTGEPR